MGSPRTILVVDDEPILREAMAIALKRRGYTVWTSDDGAEAIRLIADQLPDLAVVDMMLPGASGFQVTQALKDYSDGRVPVLMVSANACTIHQDYAFAAGADEFLAKPFVLSKLTDIVVSMCPPSTGSRAIPVAATVRS